MAATATRARKVKAERVPIHAPTVAAARRIAARGGVVTLAALAAEVGCDRASAVTWVAGARRVGDWPEGLEVRRSEPRRVRRPLTDRERRVLAAGPAVADGEGRVAMADLEAATGIPRARLGEVVGILRKRGDWGFLPVRDEGSVACPAIAAAERAKAYAGMGDGRAQVDDPREHGAHCVPRSGLDHKPAPRTAAEECRSSRCQWLKARREHRQMDWTPEGILASRGSRQAFHKADSKAVEVGVPHNTKTPPSPREPRMHRLAPMHHTRQMREG
jgi:hypothetical protein